ncbi:MAG: hypothetical protein K0Q47_11 [Sedimentibacter sp.]|jgi:hypothetical protein|nr:hypothetical protein [Sedimentibacter sp.]
MANELNNSQEEVLKTIETADFGNGGLLDPKRQKQFLTYIRDYGKMLPMVRFERLSQSQMTLDKLYIGEPVTESVEENSNAANPAKVATSQLHLQTKKLKSSWNITTETLVDNIEQKGFETTMMQGMTKRISTDIELLAIQGDRTKYNGATDTFGRLLKRANGWDALTESAHILDVGGATIQKGIFAEMVRMMPQQYLQDADLRWFVSKSVAIDWMDLLADRGTAVGDNALNGNSVSPYGIPLVEVPLLPDNKPVTSYSGKAAVVIGNQPDPFEIVAGENDKIKISIDGVTAVTVTLKPGTHRVGAIAAMINATTGLAGIASDDTHGRLVLKSKTVGNSSSIALTSIAADAYDELGLSEGTNTGTSSGSLTTTNDGSFIWLANPKNFIAAMRGTTRIYTEFNKDYDRVETVIYNEVDFSVENDDAIVKAVNLRKRDLI